MTRASAFATLAAVSLLVLVLALVAAGLFGVEQLLHEEGRVAKELGERSAARNGAEALLSAIRDTWNPDEASVDAWWTARSSSSQPGTKLSSLSSRINLNSLSPFLLKGSSLAGTLLGKSVEDFTSFRSSKGPFSQVVDYAEYFKSSSLEGLYCAQSLFNVNTADEIILEKAVAERTGNPALASGIRSRIRQYRIERKAMTEANLDEVMGIEKDALGGLLTVEPELDVNTAPVELLQALLRYPDWKLDKPDAKLQAILAGRASKPWTQEALRSALGQQKGSQLMQYLGTRCRFVVASVPAGERSRDFVAMLSYSSDVPPKVVARIVEAKWAAK
jgi:hypothetical protein